MTFGDRSFKIYRILALVVTITLWILLSTSDLDDSIPNFNVLWRSDFSNGIIRTTMESVTTKMGQFESEGGEEQEEEGKEGPKLVSVGNGTVSVTDVRANLRTQSLNHATWEYFHTLLSQFPEVSLSDPKTLVYRDKLLRLLAYIGETYPCQEKGNCIRDNISEAGLQGGKDLLGAAMIAYPLPPNLNRIVSTEWGCHVHNYVNEVLGKPQFDCAKMIRQIPGGSELAKVTLEKEEKQLG